LPKLVFKNGVTGKGPNMISKHDLLLNARHNAAKVMNFPPEYDTGDSHGMVNGMRLSNKVFNELKTHHIHEKKYLSRINDKQDKSTSELALDAKTKLILFKLVNADIIDSIGGIISTGKEAVIIYATGGK
jgi:RIO kinase 3